MTKREFLKRLSRELSLLPREERLRSLEYYSEMIDERIELGEREEDIVASLGEVPALAAELLSDAAARGELRNRARPLPTALIVIGSPLWLALLICVAAVILSVYIVAWAVIISMYAAVLALALGGLAGILWLFLSFRENLNSALFLFGAGLVCSGLALLLAVPVTKAAKALGRATARFCAQLWHRATVRFRRVK